ncbi:MAG: bile acid:sodium symporter family protein [Brumimicrobium sp.]|nr:bile acid:sodium symporter family protein [Brumimicrobium sp.]
MKINFKIPDSFVIGLLFMVGLAYLLPFNEDFSKVVPLPAIIYWGITGIFLLYGLKLELNKLKADMSNWRLNLLIQLSTFILFPVILLLFYPFLKDTSYHTLWLASFFLAALPSTVSSSVVMVSIAKGNIPAAIFNASISGLIGIIVTPLWMSIFFNNDGAGADFAEMFKGLSLQILLPVTIGIALNPLVGKYIRDRRQYVNWFDKIIIFLIVYKSFSAAFVQGVFSQVPGWTFLLLSLLIIGMFFLVFGIIGYISSLLNFSRKDKITARFCGSKKSLVHGSVFVTLIVSDPGMQSLFLLPVMIYHAFQLFYTSHVSRVYAKQI